MAPIATSRAKHHDGLNNITEQSECSEFKWGLQMSFSLPMAAYVLTASLMGVGKYQRQHDRLIITRASIGHQR